MKLILSLFIINQWIHQWIDKNEIKSFEMFCFLNPEKALWFNGEHDISLINIIMMFHVIDLMWFERK